MYQLIIIIGGGAQTRVVRKMTDNMHPRALGVVMTVRGACRSEHAHIASKWRPTMSPATECAEKPCQNTSSFEKATVPQTCAL